MKTALAIITARGGSKGIPGKNIKEVLGKPLIAYTLEAALNCPLISECYVTTDDDAIRNTSIKYGAEVLDRPPELATDTALSQDAVSNALDQLKQRGVVPSVFVLLQPTSPLRTAKHLQECLELFFSSGADCTSSVTEAEHHPLKMLIEDEGRMTPLKDVRSLELPRQVLPRAYRINGAIYVIRTDLFLETNCFFTEPYTPYIMSSEDSLDIDSEDDLVLMETILKKRNYQQ